MNSQKRNEEFAVRFARHEDELKWLYMELYHGDRKAWEYFTGMLQRMWENRPENKRSRDSTWDASPLCSLLQIAYLTQDDAFVKVMESLPLDKNCFRLGQSFYPAAPYGRNRAEEANGRWDAYRGAAWKLVPAPPFPVEYVRKFLEKSQVELSVDEKAGGAITIYAVAAGMTQKFIFTPIE